MAGLARTLLVTGKPPWSPDYGSLRTSLDIRKGNSLKYSWYHARSYVLVFVQLQALTLLFFLSSRFELESPPQVLEPTTNSSWEYCSLSCAFPLAETPICFSMVIEPRLLMPFASEASLPALGHRVHSLVIMPPAPTSLLLESLAASSPALVFLTLTSLVAIDVVYVNYVSL